MRVLNGYARRSFRREVIVNDSVMENERDDTVPLVSHIPQ